MPLRKTPITFICFIASADVNLVQTAPFKSTQALRKHLINAHAVIPAPVAKGGLSRTNDMEAAGKSTQHKLSSSCATDDNSLLRESEDSRLRPGYTSEYAPQEVWHAPYFYQARYPTDRGEEGTLTRTV